MGNGKFLGWSAALVVAAIHAHDASHFDIEPEPPHWPSTVLTTTISGTSTGTLTGTNVK